MSKYYCTFWYPTIFLEEASIRDPKEKENKPIYIDDNSKHSFEVKLTIDAQKNADNIATENITITATITEKKGEGEGDVIVDFSVVLNKIAKRSNGFIQYEFDFNLSETVCDEIKRLSKFKNDPNPIDSFRTFFQSALSKPIYHYIKEFYHIHETTTDKDSDLVAFCFEEENEYISLDSTNNCNDNKYLKRFLDNFVAVFKDKAYQASNLNFILKETLETITSIYGSGSDEFNYNEEKDKKNIYLKTNDFNKIPLEELDTIIKNHQQLDEICENTLIEYTYCKTLLCSIYNKFYRHDTETKLEQKDDEIAKIEEQISKLQNESEEANLLSANKIEKEKELNYLKELRRKALNIRSAVRYIENIKYKNQNRQYFISRVLLGKIQEQNGKITEIMGNGSVILNKVQEKNERIEKILNKGDKITKISILLACLGIFLAILSIFPNPRNSYVFIPGVVIFIILLLIFIFCKRKH